MKRTLLTALAAATVTIGAGALHAAPALAAAPLQVLIDGRPLPADAPSVLVQGRTMVQADALFASLGARVTWQNDYSSVDAQLNGNTVAMYLGVTNAWNNGQHRYLDVAPLVLSDRTLVPVRFAAESLGARVEYDGYAGTVSVTTRPGSRASLGSRASRASLGSQVAAYAQRFDGYPYGWGASGPDAFDCSGLAYYVFGNFGIEIPRVSYDQFDQGQPVATSNLQPGDLVFFSTYDSGASHVGVYLGNDQFVNAQSSRAGVTIQSLSNSYWSAHYIGARRYW